MPTSKIRLLLLEDNRLLRDGLTALLNAQPDLQVVAAFGDGDRVIQRVQDCNPQVVLMDLGLRSRNSLRLVESVRTACPDVKLIVMDLLPSHADLVAFIKGGISGFLLKDATVEEFLKSIRLVAGGNNVLPRSLTESLFSEIVNHAVERDASLPASAVRLTKREREIMALIADGRSNKEIAQRLNIATFTVKSHVHNMLEKLALHSRLQVASYAHATPGRRNASRPHDLTIGLAPDRMV